MANNLPPVTFGKGAVPITYTARQSRLPNSVPVSRYGPGVAGYVNIAANFRGTGGIPAPARKPRSSRRKAG